MTGIEQTRQRAVLDPRTAAERFRLDHEPAPADLTPLVDGYWIPHRDLTEPHRQQVLTHPVEYEALSVATTSGFTPPSRLIDGKRQFVAFDVRDGLIHSLFAVPNPDKLHRLYHPRLCSMPRPGRPTIEAQLTHRRPVCEAAGHGGEVWQWGGSVRRVGDGGMARSGPHRQR